MRALVSSRWSWSTGALALFTLLGSAGPLPPLRIAMAVAAPELGSPSLVHGACPEGTAPDGDVCVHLSVLADDGELAPSRANIHRDRAGRLASYEQIPRLPERPADYDAYRYPIPAGLPGGHAVVSGYDLDRPDDQQRRGPRLRHVGHGGVDLPQAKGTPVSLVALEHQEGDAEVLYAGPLFGNTVVTRHTLREGGRLRDYVVLFGHLDRIAAGTSAGSHLNDGDLVGTVGDTGSPSLVHLHLEIRRVREGVDLAKTPAGPALVTEAVSTVCDPRNVLPLR